jgi:hypothetical protein
MVTNVLSASEASEVQEHPRKLRKRMSDHLLPKF